MRWRFRSGFHEPRARGGMEDGIGLVVLDPSIVTLEMDSSVEKVSYDPRFPR